MVSWGFGANKVPVVSIVADQNGIGDSVVVTIQSVSQLLGFGTPDGTGHSTAPADAKIGDLAGDVNGDLDLEIVMTNEDNIKVTKIFRNDTSGIAGVMFTDTDLEEGATLTPIMALSSDIDNDGSTDFIMITQTGSTLTEEFSGYPQTIVNDHENSIPFPADF
ncbi:MAG: hypothetical protein ACI9JK_001745 [Phycisphaerales bacterium]